MSIGAVLVGVALFLVAGIAVIEPLLKQRGEHVLSATKTGQQRKQESLLAIQELDFDFQTGKIEAPDYELLRAAFVAEAAQAFEEFDRQSILTEDTLERQILDRRQAGGNVKQCGRCTSNLKAQDQYCSQCGARAQVLCRHCGSEVGGTDKFCSSCGEEIPTTIGVTE